MKARNFGKQKSGFTLIELMVVVMIIAMILSVAVPNFQRANLRAQEVRTRMDMEEVRAAMERCYLDTGTYPSPDSLDDATNPGFGWVPRGLAMNWGTKPISPSEWKGPYMKKYPTTPQVSGLSWRWDSNTSTAPHAFSIQQGNTSTEGTAYNTW